MPSDVPYEPVPVLEASGGVGLAQAAIGLAVLAFAAFLAVRPPRAHRALLFGAGLVGAFLPVVVGHVALLVSQVRTLGEMSGLGAEASQADRVRGMEQASVHTWIGWTVSGVAVPAVLLARLRRPRTAPPAPPQDAAGP